MYVCTLSYKRHTSWIASIFRSQFDWRSYSHFLLVRRPARATARRQHLLPPRYFQLDPLPLFPSHSALFLSFPFCGRRALRDVPLKYRTSLHATSDEKRPSALRPCDRGEVGSQPFKMKPQTYLTKECAFLVVARKPSHSTRVSLARF